MHDWTMALETAFVASLEMGGNIGNIGNRSEKVSHCKPRAITKAALTSYRTGATGNRQDQSFGNPQTAQKQALEPAVTKDTEITARLSAAFEERAALVEYDSGIHRAWAEGFARLDSSTPPPGLNAARWQEVIDDGGRFLDRWAEEAVRLGWQVTDVFGFEPFAPPDRFHPIGLVSLIGGGDVISITERSATIRSPDCQILIYLRGPSIGVVCLWDRVVQDVPSEFLK